MISKIITYSSNDGFLINGLWYNSHHTKKCVIHIPGLAGNFYSSSYHQAISEKYDSIGYSYFSINTRGSEYIKQLKNSITNRSEMLGYTYEIFTDCEKDIDGIINYVETQGYTEILLQGHSSGCQKILFALNSSKVLREKISQIHLLSPCDDVGLAIHEYGEKRFTNMIETAERSRRSILPGDFFFNLPISKQAFLSYFGRENKFDIFSYYKKDSDFQILRNNLIPTLVVFGENDYVLDFNRIEELYGSMHNYQIEIIPKCNHKYIGFEDKLGTILIKYASKNT